MSWAIKVEHLSKLYKIGSSQAVTESLYRKISNKVKRILNKTPAQSPDAIKTADHASVLASSQTENAPSGHFWALKDVCFEINQGERVAIIGQNGSGKSTLLKILSRITAPTEGLFRYRGKLISLLEVGTGFHIFLPGADNIYLNAALNGMSSKDIKKRFNEIVEFSELGDHINTPVQRYSSGMYMRLAFSIAAHMTSDILIVDEVLAVGDSGFQKKCKEKMLEVAGEGRTLIFVSHDMRAVQSICNKAIELSHGRIVLKLDEEKNKKPEFQIVEQETITIAPLEVIEVKAPDASAAVIDVNEAVGRYMRTAGTDVNPKKIWRDNKAPTIKKIVFIKAIRVVTTEGNIKSEFSIDDQICVEIDTEILSSVQDLKTCISIRTSREERLFFSEHSLKADVTTDWAKKIYTQRCVIPSPFLNVGQFHVDVYLSLPEKSVYKINLSDIVSFRVVKKATQDNANQNTSCILNPKLAWEVTTSSSDSMNQIREKVSNELRCIE